MVQMLKIFGVGEIMACSNVNEAKDLLTAISASKRSRYLKAIDIVLLDWLMPGDTGDVLLQWLRKNPHDSLRFLPVIVVSGYTTEYIAARARDLGAHETLVKPISGTGLASRICAVIENPRPFIKAPGFFGPDRRRKKDDYNGVERRKVNPDEIVVKYAKTE
jgi:DNA-binding response OmpR family regulator